MKAETRRNFVLGAGAGLLVACTKAQTGAATSPTSAKVEKEADVEPPEDLMREHGVLRRILFLYDEALRRVDLKQEFPGDVVASGAEIIRRFIEQYHEKLEEDFLFPRFEKQNRLVDLVTTLKRQHIAGRTLTATIMKTARSGGSRDDLFTAMRSFARMYRPHSAREDTVLFPALRQVVSHGEFKELGDQFEDKEHEMFGKAGFEGVVAEVAKLEHDLGIGDLNLFTPKVS